MANSEKIEHLLKEITDKVEETTTDRENSRKSTYKFKKINILLSGGATILLGFNWTVVNNPFFQVD